MTTPARHHRLRTLAAAQAAEHLANMGTLPPEAASAYERMLMQLAQHKAQLKHIQSVERKADAKHTFLPAYDAWIQGVLQSSRGGQDEVLTTVMVWRIDTGDLSGALPLVAYAITHGLLMPDQYHRSLPCFVAEEYAEQALKALAAGQSVDAAALNTVETLTLNSDMPDEVRAKLHKAIGTALRDSDKPAALASFTRALQLHDKCGVKKDIERLEREIRHAGDETPEIATPETAPPGTEPAAAAPSGNDG